jgi:type II secretory pathway component PulF
MNNISPQKILKEKNPLSFLDAMEISREERLYIVEQIALLISSGVPLDNALAAISRTVKSPTKKALGFVKEKIDAGYSLSAALDHIKLFPDYVISLMRLGEESGSLPKTLKMISEEQRKNFEFRSKVRSAMMYPVLVLVIATVVGSLIAWFILPRLASVFDSLHIKLPIITKILIAAGKFLGLYGYIVVPGFLLLVAIIVYLLFFNHHTKTSGEFILLHLPGASAIIRESEIARYGYMSAMLLSAGVPIVELYDALADASTLMHYKKLYCHMAHEISEGNSISKSMASYKHSAFLIPLPIQELIAVGEQSGTLREVSFSISDTYREKTDISTKNLAVIIEPILLIIVWLAVVFIALAIILPIYSLIGGLSSA